MEASINTSQIEQSNTAENQGIAIAEVLPDGEVASANAKAPPSSTLSDSDKVNEVDGAAGGALPLSSVRLAPISGREQQRREGD